MRIRNVGRLISGAGLVMAVFFQSARAEEKPGSGQDAPMAWAKVSKEQEAEASKLGIPVAFTNSAGMRFVLIPSGTFKMGSADSAEKVRAKCVGVTANPDWAEDEHPVHDVQLTSAFYMSMYEVTGQLLETVAPRPNETKEEQEANNRRRRGDRGDASGAPAVSVWWGEAVTFCEALSKREGRTYRLPTESEWEYACRAGTTTSFCFGETLSTNQANYNWTAVYGDGRPADHSPNRAMPVGSFPPNAWGLHDMHGNVWEWCSDWYGQYPDKAQTDPKGPSSGTQRVVRGGCWINSPAVCRSAKRSANDPIVDVDVIGFRVVVEVKR